MTPEGGINVTLKCNPQSQTLPLKQREEEKNKATAAALDVFIGALIVSVTINN